MMINRNRFIGQKTKLRARKGYFLVKLVHQVIIIIIIIIMSMMMRTT